MKPLGRHNNIPTRIIIWRIIIPLTYHFTFLNFLNYLQIPFSTYNFTFTLRIEKNSSRIISSFNTSPVRQFYSFLVTKNLVRWIERNASEKKKKLNFNLNVWINFSLKIDEWQIIFQSNPIQMYTNIFLIIKKSETFLWKNDLIPRKRNDMEF